LISKDPNAVSAHAVNHRSHDVIGIRVTYAPTSGCMSMSSSLRPPAGTAHPMGAA